MFVLGSGAGAVEPKTGQKYSVPLLDVDGNVFSTADGRVTVVVLATPSDVDKARSVGDRIPSYCLGNPDYRMVTVLVFAKDHSGPLRMIFTKVIRHRLDGEAKKLQARYLEKKIERDARRDVFAVADFDGKVVSQFGLARESAAFRVFVFDRAGELRVQWRDVPSLEQLAVAMK
jgi:hypothetical protein